MANSLFRRERSNRFHKIVSPKHQTHWYRPRFEPLEDRLVLSTVIVNSTGIEFDLVAGDGVCSAGEFVEDVPILNGICSLYGAIQHANSTPGLDTINFSGSGPIGRLPVPWITDPVIIDGTTAGKVEMSGTITSGTGAALSLRPGSSGSTIRGMVIHDFDVGISIESNANTIVGNFLGTNVAGTSAPGNAHAGIAIFSRLSQGNLIGGVTEADRNIISGNGIGINIFGLDVAGNPGGNMIYGNYIGTDFSGTVALGNEFVGVDITRTTGNFIGGLDPGQGNVIADNGTSAALVAGDFGGVVIRGTTSSGNIVAGNLIGTNLTGDSPLGNRNGVVIKEGTNNSVVGNVVSASVQTANFLNGLGIVVTLPTATGNTIKGNKVGTDITGLLDFGNGSDGVHIQDASGNIVGGNNDIDRNIISGNVGDGVFIGGFSAGTPALNNIVIGNYIGTNISGTAALPNDARGVHVSSHTQGNTIGGHNPGEGNVISGNGEDGVLIVTSSAVGNNVHSNYIGTNATGDAAVINQGSGINIWGGVNNIIGGTDAEPSSGNVISANQKHGVYIHEYEFLPNNIANGNQLRANLIGVGIDGITPLGNSLTGVFIEDAANNLIGASGDNPFRGNVISANLSGIIIKGEKSIGNQIVRNFIGTDFEGNLSNPTTLLGHGNWGIRIEDAKDNIIGGLPESETLHRGNTIAASFEQGILITGDNSSGNLIQQNSIFANRKIGIDLGDNTEADGVTQNDFEDADLGPNALQNFPLIQFIHRDDTSTIFLNGTMSGEPLQTYTIDFFATDTTGLTTFQEAIAGQTFLGNIEVMTDSTGFIHFEVEIDEPHIADQVYTATATSNTNMNTSEFSPFTPDLVIGAEDIRTPVIFVPGIFGSFSSTETSDYLEFITHLGLAPDKLLIDPLAHFYDDIITSFQTAGYEIGKDLFIAPYDWRIELGPSAIGGAEDGVIDLLPADLADDTIEYGVDYLAYWLKKATDAWYTRFGEALPAVNIVAHSMGGLLSRTYMQSQAYAASFTSTVAGEDLQLPMVNSFTMFGVPNQGASMVWNSWHNNFVIDTTSRLVMSKVINHAWHKMLAGTPIITPKGPITEASLQGTNEQEKQLDFLRRYSLGMKELMATYGNWGVDPSLSPATKNRLVLDLNASVLFADRVARTMVLYGTNVDTASTVVEHTGELPGFQFSDEILPFTDYLANDPDENQVWWEDVIANNEGDGTVPLESLQGLFINGGTVDERVELHPFCTTEEDHCGAPWIGTQTGGEVSHTSLPANADAQALMLEALGHPLELSQISTGSAIGGWGKAGLLKDFIGFSITLDPVEGYLVDGSGNRLGYTAAEGIKTEIPGSTWIGGSDGMGIISEAVTGPLELQLIGLGGDYYIQVAGFLLDDGDAVYSGIESSGFLALGETLNLTIDPPGLPGDFNFDEKVGLDDLLILKKNFGTTTGAEPSEGDMDNNGTVDATDLGMFLSNYGRTFSPEPSAPVPQAAAASLSIEILPTSQLSQNRISRTRVTDQVLSNLVQPKRDTKVKHSIRQQDIRIPNDETIQIISNDTAIIQAHTRRALSSRSSRGHNHRQAIDIANIVIESLLGEIL